MSLFKFNELYTNVDDFTNEYASLFTMLDASETMNAFMQYYYRVINVEYDDAYFRYDNKETIVKHVMNNIENNIPYLYLMYKVWKHYYSGSLSEEDVIKMLSKDYSSTQASVLAQEYTNHRKNLVANTPTTRYTGDDRFIDTYANEGSKDDGDGTFDQNTSKDYERIGNVERVFTNLRYIPKVISDTILKSVGELFIPFYDYDED